MKEFKMKPGLGLFISLALIFALSVTTSVAQQKTSIAGKITATYTKQETIDVGDIEGHIISLAKSEGTNVSTGEHVFIDSSQVVNISLGDLVKGNGTNQGYVKFITNGDTSFAKWQGKVTTILSTEGIPITTSEGTFSFIKGTGQFENIQGTGTFKVKFTAETTYISEWEGDYFIAPATTKK